MITRRAFVGVLAVGLLGAPLTAEGQATTVRPRVGFIEAGSRSANQHFLDAFRQGLSDLQYVDGQNIAIEDRWADGRNDRFPELIIELIRLKVEVLVVASTPGANIAKQMVTTVPVVFWGVSDPAGTGLVASLAHPGGNITGVALGTEEGLAGKWVEFLRDAAPSITRVAVLRNPSARGTEARMKEMEAAASTSKLTLHPFEARSADELEGVFGAMRRAHMGGLIVVADPLTLRHRDLVVRLAAQARIPAIYHFEEFVRAGGLMSYGPSVPDQARRAAAYVVKILQGAKPADLPVERPTTFRLVINLRAASGLGLTIPSSLLLRADEVIP